MFECVWLIEGENYFVCMRRENVTHVDKKKDFFIVDLYVDKRFSRVTKLQNSSLCLNLRLRHYTNCEQLPVKLQKPNM